MSYIWRLWIGFVLVLTVLLTAMGWLSVTAMRLDRAEALSRERAAIEENVRLALWRMDSALAPLLAQENAHPHYLDDMLSLAMATEAGRRTSTVAAPWLPADSNSPYILLRFQYPADRSGQQSLPSDTPWWETSQTRSVARRLTHRIPHASLSAKLPAAPTRLSEPRQLPAHDSSQRPKITKGFGSKGARSKSRSAVEFEQRSQALMTNNAMTLQLQNQQFSDQRMPFNDIAGIMMTPTWASGEMLLARRVRHSGEEYVQGCLIDWTAMQAWLLEMISDLLPDAILEPLEEFDTAGEAGLLAALPVRLLPGTAPAGLLQAGSAVPQTLALAWLAVLLSSSIGAVLVVGVVRLSQRRGAFVAAVTHELRTPLTTFRMYTEMLSQGMVQDAEAQREYLQTLRDQSLRLSHLVENVLAYARLERGRRMGPPKEIPLSELIEPLLPSLTQRAAADQMELVVERSRAFNVPVRANTSAVEQILINLVDNACKYAHGAADRRIRVSAHRDGRFVALRVRDHGPGLPPKRRWFQPFSKSVQEAAHSAPGVGLGLALSRRLAEQMGGGLAVDRAVTDGAALVLRLRSAAPAPAARSASGGTISDAGVSLH